MLMAMVSSGNKQVLWKKITQETCDLKYLKSDSTFVAGIIIISVVQILQSLQCANNS